MSYRLYTDGSHMYFANVAGIGGYLQDETGKTVFEFSELIENTENDKSINLAAHEIFAMEKGLTLAMEHGIKNIVCLSDSNGICKALTNIWLHKTDPENNSQYPITPETKKVASLMKHFDKIEFNWLPREKNQQADRLSRREVLKKYPQRTAEIENAFLVNNFHTGTGLNKTEKDRMVESRKTLTDFYVVNVKTGENNQITIETWYAQKTPSGEIKKELLREFKPSSNAWRQGVLTSLSDALNKSTNRRVAIALKGDGVIPIEDVLRGRGKAPKKLLQNFTHLERTIEKMDEVFLYQDAKVMKLLFEPKKEAKPLTQQQALDAMKLLGDENYVIGSHPEIENHFEMNRTKREDPTEIQKKYFGAFISLAIRDTIQYGSEGEILMAKSKEAKKVVDNIQQMRESLQEQGVKFRY
jgi:ribonuclease HI